MVLPVQSVSAINESSVVDRFFRFREIMGTAGKVESAMRLLHHGNEKSSDCSLGSVIGVVLLAARAAIIMKLDDVIIQKGEASRRLP